MSKIILGFIFIILSQNKKTRKQENKKTRKQENKKTRKQEKTKNDLEYKFYIYLLHYYHYEKSIDNK
jgi:hypothetical protein